MVALILLMTGLSAGARAQQFEVGVTSSPDPVLVGATLTYTISVTNFTATTALLYPIYVTNTLPDSFQFLSATNLSGTFSTNGQDVIFLVSSLSPGTYDELLVTAQPTVAGTFTNGITATLAGATNATASAVTQVISGQSDLSVTMTGLATAALVNDWLTYRLTATNQGSGNASGVLLTNSLPAGVNLIRVVPTNTSYITANGSLLFLVGNLAAGGGLDLRLTVQPTVAGVLTFSAGIGATGFSDSNPTNDTTSRDVTVGAFLPGQLVVTNISAQHYNPQTGLMEQTLQLLNSGTNAVASARVFVSGLGTNQLFSAAGTNDGNPWVGYGGTIGVNQSVSLVLEYFSWTRLPLTGLDFTAAATPLADLSAPSGTPFTIALVTNVASGLLLEFEAVPGQSYTIEYSDNAAFTNALAAQPALVAPANRAQWIDTGPPKTVSAPANRTARFYRVLQNP